MLKIVSSNRFKKDLKMALKRGYNIDLLEEVVNKIAQGTRLEPKHKDHELSGDFKGLRECHIAPDWLLVYQVFEDEVILYLSRTGTHSDLF